MLKHVDHIGIVVDRIEDAGRLLEDLGLTLDRSFDVPGRMVGRFYQCGGVMIEILEISDAAERVRRLGSDTARIEHIGFLVEDLNVAMDACRALGIRFQSDEPLVVGDNENVWTEASTSDGVMLQLIARVSPVQP